MSTPIAQLLSKTVQGFFSNGEVQRAVCKIARRCSVRDPLASGDTASRPAVATVGQMYFDTELEPAQPIWWNGEDWVDSAGSVIS